MSADPVSVDASSAPSSLWDRVSNWASEHRVAAYTIAGTVIIVTGAGILYYVSESRGGRTAPTPGKKKSKKERRLEKQQEKEQQEKDPINLHDDETGLSSDCAP